MLVGSGARMTCLLVLQVMGLATWAHYLTSLSLDFLVHIEGIITVFSLGLDEIIYLAQCLGHN